MFSVWVTKQVSGFCATNHMQRSIDNATVNKCPNWAARQRRQLIFLHVATEGALNYFIPWLKNLLSDSISSRLRNV